MGRGSTSHVPSRRSLLAMPIVRFAGHPLDTGSGEVVFSPDLAALPGGVVIQPGETWSFQLWFRDGASSNTSDGLAIDFE